MQHGEQTVVLQRRDEPTKNGDWVFRRAGVRATVYICPRIFAKGVVPDEITLTSPDPIFRRQGASVDPLAVQARADMLTARAERSQFRANAAQDRARKLDALAADARRAAR
jgi:hypothetical protein